MLKKITQYNNTILAQNGIVIKLDKEKEYFTAYISNKLTLEKIKNMEGVIDIKSIFNDIYKCKVNENNLNNLMDTLRNELNLVVHHAYKPLDNEGTRYYITDKIIVKFCSDCTIEQRNNLCSQYSLQYVHKFDQNTYFFQVTLKTGKNPIKVANELLSLPFIEYAEPNLINRVSPTYLPTDDKFNEQWHLKSIADVDVLDNADISATLAWDITTGSRDIVIAILDDGFDLALAEFKGKDKIVFPIDYRRGGNNPLPEENDYHGTPCAGIAIAEENNKGIVGVAPGCAFMPVRIPFGFDDNTLFKIFDEVSQKADVISCSWGIPPVHSPLSQLLYDKLTQIATNGGPRKNGCVIVFAAQNYNAPLNNTDPNARYTFWASGGMIKKTTQGVFLNGFCTHPNVITVSACTSMNEKALYSNWGKEVSVSAPSNNYHPIDKNKPLKGRGITTTDNFNVGFNLSPNSQYTNQFGGTSAACPMVAGVAALVLSVNQNLTATEVKQIITQTADKIIDNTPDTMYQYLKGTYNENQHSEWFGYGKINAYKAVLKAIEIQNANINLNNSPRLLNFAIKPLKATLSSQQNSMLFYLPIGNSLFIELSGEINTDLDMYIRKGNAPTTTIFDKQSRLPHAHEKIVFNPITLDNYYILIKSEYNKGKFNLKAQLSSNSTVKQPKNIKKLLLQASSQACITQANQLITYKLLLSKQLVVTLNSSSPIANFDVYIRNNAIPSTIEYDKCSIGNSSKEKIIFEEIKQGNYYILVIAKAGIGNFTLNAQFV